MQCRKCNFIAIIFQRYISRHLYFAWVSVCLFTSNKRQNGWTNEAIFLWQLTRPRRKFVESYNFEKIWKNPQNFEFYNYEEKMTLKCCVWYFVYKMSLLKLSVNTSWFILTLILTIVYIRKIAYSKKNLLKHITVCHKKLISENDFWNWTMFD